MVEENKYKITLINGYRTLQIWIDEVSENDMIKIITNIGKDCLFQYREGNVSTVVNLRFFSTCCVEEIG